VMDPLRENKMKRTGRHEVVVDETIGPEGETWEGLERRRRSQRGRRGREVDQIYVVLRGTFIKLHSPGRYTIQDEELLEVIELLQVGSLIRMQDHTIA
jgi:hypothetical protein